MMQMNPQQRPPQSPPPPVPRPQTPKKSVFDLQRWAKLIEPYLKRQFLPYWIGGGVLLFILVIVMTVVMVIMFAALFQTRIANDVSVAGIGIGGLTAQDAREKLNAAFASKLITISESDRNWQIPLSSLGVSLSVDEAVQAAVNARAGAQITPTYTVDFVRAQDGLISLSAQVNVPPQAGNPPVNGRSLDIPFVLDRLRINATAELSDGILELNMIEVEAPLDEEAQYTGEYTVHVVEAGQELGLIARYYGVTIEEILAVNPDIENPDLLYVGQEINIPADGVYQPDATEAPPPSTSTGKAIVVSTGDQRIYAYENGQLVRSHLVSTGTNVTPTVLGDYKVYVKLAADDMRGPDYFLPQVPWTMYFYQGYAIHGTYWHNAFGRPMSHGCVNLPVSEAEWFFQWAEVGTPVRVVA